MVIASEEKTKSQSRFPVEPRLYRVYVNSFENPDNLWSVDEGTIETERHCFQVIISTKLPVSTRTDLTIRGTFTQKYPRAWIAAPGVAREHHDRQGRSIVIITKN